MQAGMNGALLGRPIRFEASLLKTPTHAQLRRKQNDPGAARNIQQDA